MREVEVDTPDGKLLIDVDHIAAVFETGSSGIVKCIIRTDLAPDVCYNCSTSYGVIKLKIDEAKRLKP